MLQVDQINPIIQRGAVDRYGGMVTGQLLLLNYFSGKVGDGDMKKIIGINAGAKGGGFLRGIGE